MTGDLSMNVWKRTLNKHITEHFGTDVNIKVLEVGVWNALNTRHLLETYPKISLTSIDPLKSEEARQLEMEYPYRFTFIEDLSLNVMDGLDDDFDLILIDGDHNYYTVFNELETIFRKQHNNFPLVILHDTHYPWGRIDGTYNLNTIPEGKFQQERSGVLSAVEDFINEHTVEGSKDEYIFKLTLYQVGPGLGVLEVLEGGI